MDNNLKKYFNEGGEAFSEYLNANKPIFADVRTEIERTKYFKYGRNFIFVSYRLGEVVAYGDVNNPDIELTYLESGGYIVR